LVEWKKTMRIFKEEELKKYDGSNGICYVAFQGRVYDVSGSYHWRQGLHHARHRAGKDLTEPLKMAPHGAELLSRFPVVGFLAPDGGSAH